MYTWMIHLVANGMRCEKCGKIEYPFVRGICDAHTHGLKDEFDHPELFLCLDYKDKRIIGYILNRLGEMVRDGHRFDDGELVNGIFEDCPVRLDIIEKDGEKMFQVIIPDGRNLWPENPNCAMPYCLQKEPLEKLYNRGSL